MPDYDRYVGDKGMTITLDVAASDLNLAGGSAVIWVRKPDGTNMEKAGSLDAVNRTVAYIWIAGDLDQPGEYTAWGRVTVGSVYAACSPVTIFVGASPVPAT